MTHHARIYSLAEAYDLAFDFKNIPSECAFLRSVFSSIHNCEPTSFLDLAAGPALHALEMARSGITAAALDLSDEMVAYGRAKATKADLDIDYRKGDIADFCWDRSFDLAGIFMDSTSYLLTNEAFVSHLRSVASALTPGGLYVLEMNHPRDVFSVGKSSESCWSVKRDGIEVDIKWGSDSDPFDPITQVTQTTVRLTVRDLGSEKQYLDQAPQRCFTANELRALVALEGSFEITALYGAMDRTIPFSNEKSAWRMIPVLRKRSSARPRY